MERLLSRIWIFILAFGLGVSISALWRIYTLPIVPDDVGVTVPRPQETVGTVSIPKLVDAPHSCGALPSGQTYTYSDGGRVSITCKRFNSVEIASREFEKLLVGVEIAERSQEPGSSDRAPMEEELITTPVVIRLRKTGTILCEVRASSLDHLRWFENPKDHF